MSQNTVSPLLQSRINTAKSAPKPQIQDDDFDEDVAFNNTSQIAAASIAATLCISALVFGGMLYKNKQAQADAIKVSNEFHDMVANYAQNVMDYCVKIKNEIEECFASASLKIENAHVEALQISQNAVKIQQASIEQYNKTEPEKIFHEVMDLINSAKANGFQAVEDDAQGIRRTFAKVSNNGEDNIIMHEIKDGKIIRSVVSNEGHTNVEYTKGGLRTVIDFIRDFEGKPHKTSITYNEENATSSQTIVSEFLHQNGVPVLSKFVNSIKEKCTGTTETEIYELPNGILSRFALKTSANDSTSYFVDKCFNFDCNGEMESYYKGFSSDTKLCDELYANNTLVENAELSSNPDNIGRIIENSEFENFFALYRYDSYDFSPQHFTSMYEKTQDGARADEVWFATPSGEKYVKNALFDKQNSITKEGSNILKADDELYVYNKSDIDEIPYDSNWAFYNGEFRRCNMPDFSARNENGKFVRD